MGINPIADIASGIAGPLFGLVDKLFTSDEEREAAKLAIMKAEQAGELDTLKTNLSAILAEANSADPWTSRARPSFLYVMYVCCWRRSRWDSCLPLNRRSRMRSFSDSRAG
jgi:hypothetical protein